MSYFGKNIRKIRNAKKISQTAFADLFNLKRGSIGAYEEGRAEAKIDTIIEIAEYFKLTLDQLLRKELTINEIYHINERSKKLKQKNNSPKENANLIKKVVEKYPADIEKLVKLLDDRLAKIEEHLKNK
jgi:transcriptional regulator with XRE-family HTH domain